MGYKMNKARIQIESLASMVGVSITNKQPAKGGKVRVNMQVGGRSVSVVGMDGSVDTKELRKALAKANATLSL